MLFARLWSPESRLKAELQTCLLPSAYCFLLLLGTEHAGGIYAQRSASRCRR
jgi:hypothetical protein